MRLDLFLRFRRDRLNFSIRLRVLAGAAALASIVAVIAELALDEPLDLPRLPLIVVAPGLPANWPLTEQHRP